MAHSTGITLLTTANSRLAVIDLDKHEKALHSFLKKNGISTENDDFEREWAEGGYTVNEARKELHKFIDKLKWKK